MIAGRRVVIVGGGAIGLCAAYFAHRQDAEVTVVEREQPGAGASAGNAGWITRGLSVPVPAPGLGRYALASLVRPNSALSIPGWYDPHVASWLFRLWRCCTPASYERGGRMLARLNRETFALFDDMRCDGIDFKMWTDGLLLAFTNGRAAEAMLRDLAPVAEFGYSLPSEPVDSSAVHHLEPTLSRDIQAGLLLDGDRHVDPVSFASGLATHLRENGVVIRTETEAVEFASDGDRITAVLTSAGRLPADIVVVAAGAWSASLTRRIGVHLPLRAGKGYSLEGSVPGGVRRPVYFNHAKLAITPFGGNRVRVAGKMELGGLGDSVKASALRSMRRQAGQLIDGFEMAATSARTGLRPLTYDGMPVIGRTAEYRNLYLSTGHGMLGITLAPASGRALTDAIASNNFDELEPFSPARFAKARTETR